MIHFSEFESNLAFVRERINRAYHSSGREAGEVKILPVTKNHPVQAVVYAQKAGLTSVGENRVQEASEKREAFDGEVVWELIGHLQSNKTRIALETFDRIQSIDSLKLLSRVANQASEAGKILPILIQCNAGADPNKYGFSIDEMERALEVALSAESLRVDGLMTIAPLNDDPDVARSTFFRLRELRDQLAEAFGVSLSELSMGMTGDLEHAIEAGSTQIRVGTALFGARQY